jgi:hypothetical protein
VSEKSFVEPVAAKEFVRKDVSSAPKKLDKNDMWFIKFSLILISFDTVLLVLNVWLEGK